MKKLHIVNNYTNVSGKLNYQKKGEKMNEIINPLIKRLKKIHFTSRNKWN